MKGKAEKAKYYARKINQIVKGGNGDLKFYLKKVTSDGWRLKSFNKFYKTIYNEEIPMEK